MLFDFFIALNIVTIDHRDGSLRARPFRRGSGLFSIDFTSLHDSFSIHTYLTSTVELFDEPISFGFFIDIFCIYHLVCVCIGIRKIRIRCRNGCDRVMW